jgi:hypothetical protein
MKTSGTLRGLAHLLAGRAPTLAMESFFAAGIIFCSLKIAPNLIKMIRKTKGACEWAQPQEGKQR